MAMICRNGCCECIGCMECMDKEIDFDDYYEEDDGLEY
jgi:hypothetical protein